MQHTPHTTRGYTLIELMTVIAIVAILMTVSVQGLQSFRNSAGRDASARVVLGALEEAHARTLSGDNSTQYGVHFETAGVTLFEGDTYVAGDPNNNVRNLSQATVSNISLIGGASDVVFSRLRGTASATGTVTVTQTRDTSVSRTITIHQTGLVEINP